MPKPTRNPERAALYEEAQMLVHDGTCAGLSTLVFVFDPTRPDDVKVFEPEQVPHEFREALRDWLRI